ncbi:unnamed protein product [Triticum turgidum subsp. durum]|uniref:Uncharacterized protein n=1 Tax=Triticum turgidum subsp. durum TaxID=4567 RepID=A0A9R0XZL3_TRITD|nr:unnamed protein product [Triticum turgidum subsp. durum]
MTSPTATTTRSADHMSRMTAGLGSIDQFKLGSGAAPAAARRCSGSICISTTRQLGGATPPPASPAAQQLPLQLGGVESADGTTLACIRDPLVIRSILSDIGGPNSILLGKVITIASSTGPNSVLKNLLRWHLSRLCRHSLKLVTFHNKGGSNKTVVAAIVAQPSLEGGVDT